MPGLEQERVERLFEQAAARAPGEREIFLRLACGADEALKQEVESLLAAERRAGAFLETGAATPSPASAAAEGPRFLGPYKLVAQIGLGGMSTVHLAVRADDQLNRRVAIKQLPLALVSPEHLQRFHTERQILASLDHPYIAHLYDAGVTDEGLPYLVMEYIEGEPIDDYCRRQGLGLRQRLLLFRKVCAAVHYAHQNLVVHRDLKPGNILVKADGTPKLLDFGIAKLLNPDLMGSGQLPITHNLALTPAYASPEQLQGHPLTTASDVYGLGVLLYELLTGQLPFSWEGLSRQEIGARLENETPLRPSAARRLSISAAAPGERPLPALAPRCLEGDLDAITMMALRKEPQRRYGSAEQLSEDLRLHLAGLPVLARPDTLAYRVGKLVGRNRVWVAMTTLFLAAIVGLAAISLHQANRLRREQAETRSEQAKAAQVVAALKRLLEISKPEIARQEVLDIRAILERGTRIVDDLDDQPAVQAELLHLLGNLYRNLGAYPEAKHSLRKALRLRRATPGEGREEQACNLLDLGEVLALGGDYAAADVLMRHGLRLQEQVLARGHPDHAAALSKRALILVHLGAFDRAEALLREALARQRESLGVGEPALIETLNNLGGVLNERGDHRAAERYFAEAVDLSRQHLGTDHPLLAASLNNLGYALQDLGALERAEPVIREALAIRKRILGADHPDVAVTLNNLALLLRQRGELEAAEPLYRRSLAIRQQTLGDQHPQVATALNNLASLLRLRGELEAAEPLYREALAILRAAVEGGHPHLVGTLNNLASLLTDLERYEEAEALLLESQSRQEPGGDVNGVRARRTRELLAALYQASSQHQRLAALEQGR